MGATSEETTVGRSSSLQEPAAGRGSARALRPRFSQLVRGGELRICLIVEERYRTQRMPMSVAGELRAQGHDVTVLEPQATVSSLGDLMSAGDGGFDAYVLKTVTDGPGQCLIEAAAACGLATVNDARAIRLVRDKAVAAAMARTHGVPFPTTYFLARPNLLAQVPAHLYPLVVKPSDGSEGRGVRLVESPAAARELVLSGELGTADGAGFLIAQPHQRNSGYDIKVYNAGGRIFAVKRPSPLGGTVEDDQPMAVPPALRSMILHIGRVFGLDIYGVDVLETPTGWVAVDINDFPSFSTVPEAASWVADAIVAAVRRRRPVRPIPSLRTSWAMVPATAGAA